MESHVEIIMLSQWQSKSAGPNHFESHDSFATYFDLERKLVIVL